MNSKETSQTDQQASVEQPIKRRPYDRPVLVNLGSLREMTTKLTAAGGADGGKKQCLAAPAGMADDNSRIIAFGAHSQSGFGVMRSGS